MKCLLTKANDGKTSIACHDKFNKESFVFAWFLLTSFYSTHMKRREQKTEKIHSGSEITMTRTRRKTKSSGWRFSSLSLDTFGIPECHNGKEFWYLLLGKNSRRSVPNPEEYPFRHRSRCVFSRHNELFWRNSSAKRATRCRRNECFSSSMSYLTMMIDEPRFVSLISRIDDVQWIDGKHVTTDTLDDSLRRTKKRSSSFTLRSFSRSRWSVNDCRMTSPVYSIIICPSTRSSSVKRPQPWIDDVPTKRTRVEKYAKYDRRRVTDACWRRICLREGEKMKIKVIDEECLPDKTQRFVELEGVQRRLNRSMRIR